MISQNLRDPWSPGPYVYVYAWEALAMELRAPVQGMGFFLPCLRVYLGFLRFRV